jgi:hypothetical protein
MTRNPHVSWQKEPITVEQLDQLISRLSGFWEDTMLVTKPNGHQIIELGNLLAIAQQLRANAGQLSL